MNKVKKGVAGREYRCQMACLENEKPFTVARKQDVWGKNCSRKDERYEHELEQD